MFLRNETINQRAFSVRHKGVFSIDSRRHGGNLSAHFLRVQLHNHHSVNFLMLIFPSYQIEKFVLVFALHLQFYNGTYCFFDRFSKRHVVSKKQCRQGNKCFITIKFYAKFHRTFVLKKIKIGMAKAIVNYSLEFAIEILFVSNISVAKSEAIY